MFIVVEGTDASGKTSLISAVEKEVRKSISRSQDYDVPQGTSS
jgi:thymidylate kinase